MINQVTFYGRQSTQTITILNIVVHDSAELPISLLQII